MNRSPVLVAGGSGYFGSLLARRVLQEGHRVRVLDLNEPDADCREIEFLRTDVRDFDGVRRACDGVETVFHCVAQVPLAKNRELLWSVNRDGTATLLQAALAAGVKQVIYLSSSAVYGVPSQVPITAQTPPSPVEDYGAAKLAGEELCRSFAEKGLDVVIIRPRTIMGHGRLGIMQILFEWIYEGRNVYVLGTGQNLYQFVHADDLADACIKATQVRGFAAYNIGAARFGTMRNTLEGLVAHAGTGSQVRSLPHGPAVFAMKLTSWLKMSPLAPYHWLAYGKDVYFDLSKAEQELGWHPQWGNVEMFIQSYEWYCANRQQVLAERGRSSHRSALRQGVLKLLRWF